MASGKGRTHGQRRFRTTIRQGFPLKAAPEVRRGGQATAMDFFRIEENLGHSLTPIIRVTDHGVKPDRRQ